MFVGEEIESDQTLTFHRCFLPSRFEAALFQKEQAAADFGLPTSSHRGCRYVGKLVPSRGGVGRESGENHVIDTIFFNILQNFHPNNIYAFDHKFENHESACERAFLRCVSIAHFP